MMPGRAAFDDAAQRADGRTLRRGPCGGGRDRGETPRQRPRGGAVWLPRTFVRRVAWHALDHTWEIEDRIE